MLREQIERAQKMARTDDGSGQDGAADPAATELRREELDAPLGFQLAAGRAAAAAAAAEQQQQQQRPKPAVAFDEDGGAGGGAGQQRGGKRSKIEELMEKVGGLGLLLLVGLVGPCSFLMDSCAPGRPRCACRWVQGSSVTACQPSVLGRHHSTQTCKWAILRCRTGQPRRRRRHRMQHGWRRRSG